MRVRSTSCILVFFMVAILVGIAGHAGALGPDCNHGGPCTCGELYNLDRCTGIGDKACGCGSGFGGPSLGPTSDCGTNSRGGCCLPTNETFGSACLGRSDGFACTSAAECTSGACVNSVCAQLQHGGTAPALSAVSQMILMAGLLLGGAWALRRRYH